MLLTDVSTFDKVKSRVMHDPLPFVNGGGKGGGKRLHVSWAVAVESDRRV